MPHNQSVHVGVERTHNPQLYVDHDQELLHNKQSVHLHAWCFSTSGNQACMHSHLVLLDNLPASAGVRVGGNALKDHILGPIEQGPIGEVGVACDPATIGCAPVNIPRL